MIPDRCLALPPAVLDRTDLSSIAKLVATALNDRFARFDPCTWVGNLTLAKAVGKSVGHVRRGLAELVWRGLVGREMTDQTPTGRRLWLLWREAATDLFFGAQPPCPPARTYRIEALTVGQLRNVTRVETTEPGEDRQEAERPLAASPMVPPIPAMIQSLKYGAPPDVRADLVNRIAHRLRDKKPATYGFVRKWVNAAADGVAGALEALAHGYLKAEAAVMNHHPCPGRVLVRRVQDHAFRPPAPSTIGAGETHQAARAVPVAAPAVQASPAMTEAVLVEELERARVLAKRFGGGFRQMEADIQGQLDVLRARAAP
jgi:hypothetical protein